MKAKYLKPKQGKVIRKKVMILSLIVASILQGQKFTEQEVLALTNTYDEVNIEYEIEGNYDPEYELPEVEGVEEKTTEPVVTTIRYNYNESKDKNDEDKINKNKTSNLTFRDRYSYETGLDPDRHYINVKNPENRFDGLEDPSNEEANEHKEIVKGAYTAKYYDKKIAKKYSKYESRNREWGDVYLLYNHIPLRKAIESKYGIKNVYGGARYYAVKAGAPKYCHYDIGNAAMVRDTTMGSALCLNKVMQNSLKSKTSRAYLTELAVDAGITTASDSSAPEAALCVYYGVFNNEFSTVNLKYSPKHKLNRIEAQVLITKFSQGWCYGDIAPSESSNNSRLDKLYGTKKYSNYLDNDCTTSFQFSYYNKKQGKSQVTKLEFINGLINQYYNYCYNATIKVTDSMMKKIIKKYHLSNNPTAYLKKAEQMNESLNEYKQIISHSKQMSRSMLRTIVIADKIGLIKPNASGKYNWYGAVTEQEALKLMTKAAMNSYYPVCYTSGCTGRFTWDMKKELKANGVTIPGMYNYDPEEEGFVEQ